MTIHSEFLLNIHILSVVGHFLVGFYSITTKHIREKISKHNKNSLVNIVKVILAMGEVSQTSATSPRAT